MENGYFLHFRVWHICSRLIGWLIDWNPWPLAVLFCGLSISRRTFFSPEEQDSHFCIHREFLFVSVGWVPEGSFCNVHWACSWWVWSFSRLIDWLTEWGDQFALVYVSMVDWLIEWYTTAAKPELENHGFGSFFHDFNWHMSGYAAKFSYLSLSVSMGIKGFGYLLKIEAEKQATKVSIFSSHLCMFFFSYWSMKTRMVGWLICGRFICCFDCQSIDWLIGASSIWLIDWLVGRLIDWLIAVVKSFPSQMSFLFSFFFQAGLWKMPPFPEYFVQNQKTAIERYEEMKQQQQTKRRDPLPSSSVSYLTGTTPTSAPPPPRAPSTQYGGGNIYPRSTNGAAPAPAYSRYTRNGITTASREVVPAQVIASRSTMGVMKQPLDSSYSRELRDRISGATSKPIQKSRTSTGDWRIWMGYCILVLAVDSLIFHNPYVCLCRRTGRLHNQRLRWRTW